MIKKFICASMLAGAALSGTAHAQDALLVSTWGGSFRDLIDENIGREFTRQTGVPVKYITGGTIDRLNKAKLATKPESDITFTTSHIGWLYVNAGLYEKLDLSKIPNYAHLVDRAKISPYHIGSWARATASICWSVSSEASSTTPAGLPPAGVVVKAA